MTAHTHKQDLGTMRRRRQFLFFLFPFSFLLLFSALCAGQQPSKPAPVTRVDAVGMTVSDMDRSIDFFSKILSFEKVSETEVAGEDYEHLEGLFGLRMRIVR